jgi:hypothetical protein
MRSHGMMLAREELTKRDGPCPPDKDLCRHTCDNDSMAPNGFVCTLHTVWGTQKENEWINLKKLENLQVESRYWKKNCAIERTCPYCGRTIKGPGYFSHERSCKLAPPPSVVASE